MTISLIAAISETGQLGYKNQLLTHLPNDLKHFRKLTENNIIIMGRKTLDSIGKSLPKRTNIILTRDKEFEAQGCFIYHSIDDILHEYHNYGEDQANVFVIGGGNVYSQFLHHADKIYLTRIHHTFPNADSYFPEFNESEWELTSQEHHKADDKHAYDYTFEEYVRKVK